MEKLNLLVEGQELEGAGRTLHWPTPTCLLLVSVTWIDELYYLVLRNVALEALQRSLR